MADLDSFFAKKDKKKGKTVKKFTTTEEVAKKLEDITFKKDKVKKENNPDVTYNDNENEDEWKELQEDKKDYSGLRLQPLKQSESNDSDNDKGQNDSSEEGNDGTDGGKKKANGPWKMSSENQTEKTEEVEEEKPASTNKAYVPPASRNKALGPMIDSGRKTAPELSSTVAFPTLAAAAATSSGGPKSENIWNKRKDEASRSMGSNSISHAGSGGQTADLSRIGSNSSNPNVYRPPCMK